jgi:coproporphyrinogen III oxidase
MDEESYPEAKRMLDELEGEEFELTIAPVGDAEGTPFSEDAYVLHAYVKRECERAPDPRPAIKRRCDEYFALLERIVCECHEKFENR